MKKLWKILVNILLWLAAIIHLYPIFLVMISALKSKKDLSANPIGLPEKIIFDNFLISFERMNYFRSLFNTAFITSISIILLLIFSSMAAYAVERNKNKLYRFFYLLFLAGMIVPFQMTMIPQYKLMSGLGLLNTYQGMISVNIAAGVSFCMFVLAGFVVTIPKEIEEAAYVDGCGVYKTFFVVVLPMLKPALVTVAILRGFGIWNDYLMPMLYLPRKEMRTLVPQIAAFIGEYFNDWSLIFASIFIIIYPILIIYIFAQKHIVGGITAGAVKG